MNTKPNISKQWWNKLTGDTGEFTMENRAFNYIAIISFVLLICSLFFDCFFGINLMTVITVILVFILSGCYYLSRFKKQYNISIIIYAFCSYAALIINYFHNSGSLGSTITLFFVTFTFFITFTRFRQHPIWLSLHIILFVGLVVIEYNHPEWVPASYPGRFTRFADIIWTYVFSIFIIFLIPF